MLLFSELLNKPTFKNHKWATGHQNDWYHEKNTNCKDSANDTNLPCAVKKIVPKICPINQFLDN